MSRTMGAWVATLSLVSSWQGVGRAQSTAYRTATELVNLNVSVIGANLRHVDGLTEEQFDVFEDGIPQRLRFFAPADLPLDIGILLDTSGSMVGSITLVQQAANRFVSSLRPNDRASVMAISNGLRVLQPFTNDSALLQQAVTSVSAKGRTPLYASIYSALTELARATKAVNGTPRRAALVVLSDGMDTSSHLTFDDLLAIVRRHAIPIYTIAPRARTIERTSRELALGEATRRRDFELRALAGDTGGQAFFPTHVGRLSQVYDSIAEELAHQYSLGYVSSNSTADGSFRRISVRVLAPGMRWRTRAGYVADRAPERGTGPASDR